MIDLINYTIGIVAGIFLTKTYTKPSELAIAALAYIFIWAFLEYYIHI